MIDSTSKVIGNQSGDDELPESSWPITLIIVTILSAVLSMVSVVMFIIGVSSNYIPLIFGGLVCSGFYLAILIGLIKKREWARISLIWLCYVGIASYGFQWMANPRTAPIVMPLLALETITLFFAHNRSVRQMTKGASIAKVYTYHE